MRSASCALALNHAINDAALALNRLGNCTIASLHIPNGFRCSCDPLTFNGAFAPIGRVI